MRAIEVASHGGPDVLIATDVPPPVPGPTDLLVDVECAGVNFIDTYFRTGAYPQEVPYIPGSEGTGIVREVGGDVDGFAPGDRVAWASAPGSYAEQVCVPAAVAVAVPAGVSPAQAASALLQGMTAHYLVHSTYPVQSGDTVLVHAGAGGVGLLLTQMAANLGASVLTTVSTDEKEALSRAAGAVEVYRYDDDVADRARAFTGGDGVAAVYDGVGAATFDTSVAAVRTRGTVVLFGAASGPVPPVDPQRLNAAGSIYLTRPSLGAYIRDRQELVWRAGDVFTALADGSLNLRVGAEYPLEEAAQAHRDLEGRRTTGSIVLRVQ
ncbi:MAG: quinone oxidoreductase [Rhodococcus sp.]|nr:quinone oxidoreductase [Rhodococcus sp. (in: high G+C Gram-positive bacteria)]